MSTSARPYLALMMALLVLAGVTGCGGGSSTRGSTTATAAPATTPTATPTTADTTTVATTPPPTSTLGARAPAALSGTYQARLKGDDRNRIRAGTWQLSFAGGRMTVDAPDGTSASGPAKLAAGGALTLGPTKLCTRKVSGHYVVRSRKGVLRFQPVGTGDDCDFRKALLSGAAWRR